MSSYFAKRPHFRVFVSFFLYALLLGAIFPRLPDLRESMNIEEGALGLGLIGSAVGTQIALAFGGPVLERLGYKTAMLVSVPLIGVAEVLATLAPGPLVFFFYLLFGDIGIGLVETVLNVEADRTEAVVGKRIMSRAHAFWSLGFMGAALFGALFIRLGLDPTTHMIVMLLGVTVLNFVIFSGYVPAPKRSDEEGPAPRFVFPSKAILVLVVFTLSAMLLEGASLDWSTIYMNDVHRTLPEISSLTLAAFTFTMALTRFYADGFVERFGMVAVARVLIACMGVGALAIAAAPVPLVALTGFVLLGIGTSAIFPLAMSAAAQRNDRPSAVNVASLAQLSFITFLLAPPLLGFVAEHFGIRMSYAVGLPFVLFSWLALNRLARNEPAGRKATTAGA